MGAAREAPTLTKNLLNLPRISFLSLMGLSLHLNLVHTGLVFFLLMTFQGSAMTFSHLTYVHKASSDND